MVADEVVSRLRAAVARMAADLGARAPALEQPVWTWIERRASRDAPEEYFARDWGFPIFALPLWAAASIGEADDEFLADVTFSTLNGYWFVRLIDDLMDADLPTPPQLLPALAFFHSRFEAPYRRWFPASHPFWEQFDRAWMSGAAAAAADARPQVRDEKTFEAVAARKIDAATIPVAAVCLRRDRSNSLPAWVKVCGLYGRAVQMADDMFDSLSDIGRDEDATFFLAEGHRRRMADEPLVAWAAREGLAWGTSACLAWLEEIARLAAELDCAALGADVAARRSRLLFESEARREVMLSLLPLARVMNQPRQQRNQR